MNESKKEGWGSPARSRKWHYFINTMALCRKYGFYQGYLEEGNDDNPENCVTCQKVKKLKAG